MTHLSDAEFVDFLEETLDPRRAAHVESCAECREQAEALGVMLRSAAMVDVPEPSPLFWDHFQAHVRARVAAAPAPERSGWLAIGVRGLMSFAAVAALVIAVASGALLVRGGGRHPAPLLTSGPVAMAVPAPDRRIDGVPDDENSEVWAVLTEAASTVELEEAHDAGMHVRPAVIDNAVQQMSAAELTELGRLLQSELKRASN